MLGDPRNPIKYPMHILTYGQYCASITTTSQRLRDIRRLGPLGHRCIWTLDHRLWTDVPAWTDRFDTLAQHQTEFLAALA